MPGGLGSRSKYKVDPSVQSAPLYNQYSFNNPVTSQPYGYSSPAAEQFGSGGPAYGQPAQLNQSGLSPAVNGAYYNPQATPEPAMAAVPSKPVPPGWNDPPMMSSKPKVCTIYSTSCQ